MPERRVYRFRLEPNAAQTDALNRFAGARRFVFNWSLARRKETYLATGKAVAWSVLSTELTALKRQPATAWLGEIDSQLLQQSLADCKRAFDNFFQKRARFPRFKKKHDAKQSFRIPQRISLENGLVRLPKIGAIRLRQSRAVEGQIKSATFKRDALGHWHVCLVAEFELTAQPPTQVAFDEVIGIDLGVKSLLVTSAGEDIAAPKFFRKAERKLRKAQRLLARRKKGSARRRKAKLRVARVHAQIADRRADFIHKATFRLVQENVAVSIEDLNVRGMSKTKLSKSVLDAGLGEFSRQIEYKTRWYGRHLVRVDRFFPSSKLCSVCGYKHETLQLADRQWDCPDCGTSHHRDFNAARNIQAEGFRLLVAAGLSETLNARGASVRPGKPGNWR